MTLHLVSVFPSFSHTSADMSALQMDYSFKSMLCDFNTTISRKMISVTVCYDVYIGTYTHFVCYHYYSNQHYGDF